MNKKSFFIVIEGLDGSGKSTQAKLIKEYLEKLGRQCHVTKEPTDWSEPGKRARAIIQKEIKAPPEDLQGFMAQDRKEHLQKEITPNLQKGIDVISDRYFFSTIAYGSLDCSPKWLKSLNSGFPIPDITLFIDTNTKTCIKRMESRGKKLDLFETEEKLKKIRRAYLELAENYKNFKIIDGNGTIQNVFKLVKKELQTLNI